MGMFGLGGYLADTFEWCKTCGLVRLDYPREKITNYGGDFCLLKKKRASNKLCDNWIRRPEKS